MSGIKKRQIHSAEFKAKVGLEAIRGMKTINEIAQEFGLHPVQVSQYKKLILDQAGQLFEGKRGPKPVSEHSEPERLYSEIGKLKVEVGLAQKKVRDQPALKRRSWISESCKITVVRQCELVGVCRASVYRKCKPVRTAELEQLQCELTDKPR